MNDPGRRALERRTSRKTDRRKPPPQRAAPERGRSNGILVFGERQRREFEASPRPMRIFDRETLRYLAVNDAALQLYGYTREEFLALTTKATRHPDEHADLIASLDRPEGCLLHIGERRRHLKKSGEVINAEVISQDVLFNGRRARVSITIDETERAQSENELRRQMNLFAAIVDNLPVGVFIRDAKMLRYVLRNRLCEEMNGYPVGSSMGKTIHDLFPREQADAATATDRKALETGQMQDVPEQEMLGRSGEQRIFHVRKFPLYGEEGEPWLILGIADDITDRKRSERELRDSEERFELVVENTGLGMWDWNVRTKEVWRHPRWAQILGYEPQEVPGDLCMWQELCHPDDWPQAQENLLAHFEGKTPAYEAEYRMRAKEGKWIWIRCRGKVVERTEDGEPVRMLGYIRDMSRRKMIESALVESREQFRAVTETANDAIVSADSSGRIVHFNHAASTTFGYTAEEVVGALLTLLMPARFHAAHQSGFQKFLGGHSSRIVGKTTEMTGRRKDGTEFPLELSLANWRSGDSVFFTGIMRDITGRKSAEYALRESEERFRQLSENIREVFWINTPSGDEMVYVSPAYEEIWGMSCESLYRNPRSWMDPIHPDDRPALEGVSNLLSRGEHMEAEYRIIRPDGTIRWIRDRSYPTRRGDGTLLNCGIAEDITSRKRVEEERITHAIHQRDALVREVHHRIKNHLQGIAGLLRNKSADHPAVAETIEAAVAQLQSVAVVYGLQSELAESGVPLCRVLEAICSSAEGLSSTRVVRDFAADAGKTWLADAEAVPIAVALNELVYNAIEHGARRGKSPAIEVVLTETSNSADIRIVNRGRLPARFNYGRSIGTGTGLDLVRTLLGPAGDNLEFRARDGKVEVTLGLGPPLIATREPKRREGNRK